MCWTKTTIPALQGDSEVHKKFGLCKAALAEIPGKTIFGFYRTQFNDQWGCELFIAWDSAIALEDARADVCIALLPVLPEGSATMTEAEFDTYTVRHEGKIWTTTGEVQHNPEPVAGNAAGAPPSSSIIGMNVMHLIKPGYITNFCEAFSKHAQKINDIPGKGYFGYFYPPAPADTSAPTVFTFWDSTRLKDQGKTTLWNVMMDTKEGVHDSSYSVHTEASGGMFKCDSDRTYHEALVSNSYFGFF